MKVIGVCGLVGATEILKLFPSHIFPESLSCLTNEKMNVKHQNITKNPAEHFDEELWKYFVRTQKKRTKIFFWTYEKNFWRYEKKFKAGRTKKILDVQKFVF